MMDESWEDQTMRGNRLLTDCQQLVTLHTVLTPAQTVANACAEYHSVEPPAQATAPDPIWCEACGVDGVRTASSFCGYHYGLAVRSAYEAETAAESVDAALVAERASHQAEVEALRREIAVDDQIIADRQRILDACQCPVHGSCVPHVLKTLSELFTREREAFMAGVRLDWTGVHDTQVLWRFDAPHDYTQEELDSAFAAYRALQEAKVLAMRQDVRERNELRDEPEQEQRKGENL